MELSENLRISVPILVTAKKTLVNVGRSFESVHNNYNSKDTVSEYSLIQYIC